jgi:tRNA (mo5U34)-methyltransferase
MVQQVEDLGPWFHNYEIADGVWTNPTGAGPGVDYPAIRWGGIKDIMPDVTGKTCLDVGCSSGFFSLKFKELGASRVVGVDDGEQPKAIDQARFASAQMGLDARFDKVSIYELHDELNEQFDVVACMGVFYHLRHPLLALEQLRAVCRGNLIFQTITTKHTTGTPVELKPESIANMDFRSPVLMHESFPTLRFIEGALGEDTTCWFVPNPEAVFAMLRSSGFTIQQMTFPTEHEIFVVCGVKS